ncbi:hypothetical protein QBC32DRAFT_14603 [Pseudoneurospora amorphoporcata]|uniref:Uncharacterized protein n=1 Tax=Pseudoneurospora amorphoporcata TaxID=241081 RepID=A0AAN6SDN0_9PEZI|nr:hypothetical protein QBC32DRAFT_14603 [Pseudoneurospora amorphoporcata]
MVSITSSVDADPGFERDTSGVLGSFLFVTAGFGNGGLLNEVSARMDMADMLWFLWFTFCFSLAHPSHLHSFRLQPRRSWDGPRRDRISKQASPFLENLDVLDGCGSSWPL